MANPVVNIVGALVRAAIRSFLWTWLAMFLLGIALAVAAGYFMPDVPAVVRVLIELFIVLEFVVLGAWLAGRRALLGTLIFGLRRQRLAQSSVRLLFDRFAAVSQDETPGDRGNLVVRAAERLPLDRAEELLRRILRGLAGGIASRPGLAGRMGQRLQSELLGSVETVTLDRFREQDAQHGGVDVLRVRQELEKHIDSLLIGRLRWTVNLWTIALLTIAIAQVFALVYVANFLAGR